MSDLTDDAISGDFRVVPEEGGSLIEGVNHRLVFVRDRYEPTAIDLRLHSLDKAVATFQTDVRFRGDGESDKPGEILAAAERYYDFLANYEAGNEAGS